MIKETQIASLTKQLDEDQQEVLEDYRLVAGEITNFMLPYFLPTDQRLLLFEWLFELCEPGIFKTNEFANGEKVRNLELAWKQYGIKQQGKRPIEESIRGTNGITEAINFLWEVVDFARHLLIFENLENQQLNVSNNIKLVNFICQNSAKVFTENVRLFSPGFPKLDEVDHESIGKVMQTKDELKAHLEKSKKELKEQEQVIDQSLTENATPQELETLEITLKETRDNVVLFKQEWESGFKNKLAKIQENSLSGVESLVENVYYLRQKSGKISDNVGCILSTVNELHI